MSEPFVVRADQASRPLNVVRDKKALIRFQTSTLEVNLGSLTK